MIAGASASAPDGRKVYVAAGDALVILDRDADSGALTAKPRAAGCVSQDGTDGLGKFSPYPAGAQGCARGRGLREADSVVVSPDGMNVYVAGVDGSALRSLTAVDR